MSNVKSVGISAPTRSSSMRTRTGSMRIRSSSVRTASSSHGDASDAKVGPSDADVGTSVRTSGSEIDVKKLYSLSLSQIRKHSELANHNYKPSPFNIRWIHGYNAKVGVINLNKEGSTLAFYAAGNCAVIYNWTTNEMRILQGHRHMVTCIAADSGGRWLVTADSGPENMLIVWDTGDYFPLKTLFSPHGGVNVARVALSPDAKYLLTIGYMEKAIVYWWIWSFGVDEAHAQLEIEIPRGAILDMAFNPSRTEQFVLMTKYDIWIGVSEKIFVMERGVLKETDDYELKIKTVDKKQNVEFGRLSCFTFVNETSQILVGSTRGYVLVYGYTAEYRQNYVSTGRIEDMKFVKGLKMEQCKIEVIKDVDGVIVTGNTDGEIHFYDSQMKLLYWVHGFTVDRVTGLSFNISPRSYQILDPMCNKPCLCWEKVELSVDPETGVKRQKLLKKKLPTDATVGHKPFVLRDFIVCTKNEGVGFVDFVTEKNHTILNNKPAAALALTVHPEKPYVCVGYEDGMVDLYNFVQHNLFARLDLCDHYKVVTQPDADSITCLVAVTVPQLSVACLKYSPSGLHLACGLNTGALLFLDPTTIEIRTEKPFKDTKHAIKEIAYSPDSLTMAFADVGKTICLYKYDCNCNGWRFIAKHRAHYKGITSVFFLPEKNESDDYKLISLGADRTMVEYDIGASSDEYLEVFSLDRIDQSAVPLVGIPWHMPKDLDPEIHRDNVPMILIANDEHKYKIINYKTTMTLSTVLGPRFEHPVRTMQLVTRNEEELSQYLLFATKNVIGLQKMPLDGNPWKHIGLLAHPLEVLQMCYREDHGALFTIGAKDSCLSQWAANYRAVDTTTKLGGIDLDPYYCLIENGRPGWLFHEIRDLFYYIQILCQGTFSPSIRRVKDYIPIDTLPDLMRALGFFPSEYEVENLIVEAKYKVYQREPSTEIDFEEFVKLYLNHRPAFLTSCRRVKNSFKNFATVIDGTYSISRDNFVSMLKDYGECFSKELVWYLLSILCGHSFEDRAAMELEDFSFLPETITMSDLLTNIMGVQDYDTLSEQYDGRYSGSSDQTVTSHSDDR